MTDRMMSRRRLFEAAAGALLLSGCSVQEDSSTKKVKKQDKIKKAEASNEAKHLRDKDELYEVYDDSGIVTMYLTVSRGNRSENTDHSWAEINTYSVYDYADMGVTRYQVMGLLQPGDEDGPVAGEVGYGEEAPNATVQVRGQTSSNNSQKNYKVELKKGKGTWRQQPHGRGYAFSQQDGLRPYPRDSPDDGPAHAVCASVGVRPDRKVQRYL